MQRALIDILRALERDWLFVVLRDLAVDANQVGGGEQRAHVRIEMTERNAQAARPIDLSVQLEFDLRRLILLCYLCFEQREISLLIEEAGNFVARAHGPPAEIGPFAVQGHVNSQIGLRMRLRPACHFGKPRARNQDARGSHPSVFQRLGNGTIHRVRHAEIVGMNNEQTGGGRIAQFFLNGLFSRLLCECRCDQEYCAENGSHRWTGKCKTLAEIWTEARPANSKFPPTAAANVLAPGDEVGCASFSKACRLLIC